VVVTQQDLATLRAILPDEDDARHLFHAISNGAEYFVTYDKATILKHRAAIEDEFSILPRLPSELATELGL
jgi:predicted nucleic acid-binding protein